MDNEQLLLPGTAPEQITETVTATNPPSEGDVAEVKPYQTHFKGIMLTDIAKAWIETNVGEPSKGQYTQVVYNLAFRLRHICEYNPIAVYNAVPHFDLDSDTVKAECVKACKAARNGMPADLQSVINKLEMQMHLKECEDEEAVDYLTDEEKDLNAFLDTSTLPPLPPVFKEYASIAPQGFAPLAVISLLPILGTLASRARAYFIDKRQHSPSFFVCIIGKASSGKSFIRDIADFCLKPIKTVDEKGWKEEEEYNDVVTRSGKGKSKKELPPEPKPIIRLLAPTISVTKLLKRLKNAEELHCLTVAEEIDVVRQAMGRSFSNTSALIRVAFDGSQYSQDYASDNSFSGGVKAYYNLLYSGTPTAVKALFNKQNQENGFVSRFIIADLKRAQYEEVPTWKDFDPKQKQTIQDAVRMLNSISVSSYVAPDKNGNDEIVYHPNEEYMLELPWLNMYIHQWEADLRDKCRIAQSEKHDDLYLRPGVVGFRAGMLAWLLYGQKNSKEVKDDVCKFAVWVASYMLNGLVEHMDEVEYNTKKVPFSDLFYSLPDEFSREELISGMTKLGMVTSPSQVIWRWRNCEKLIVGDRLRNPQKFTKVTS